MFRPRSSNAIGGLRVLLQNVSPQQPVIGDPPRVLTLPQRHPELLLPLNEPLQVRLVYLHLPSIGPADRPGLPIPARHNQSPNTTAQVPVAATPNASGFDNRTILRGPHQHWPQPSMPDTQTKNDEPLRA